MYDQRNAALLVEHRGLQDRLDALGEEPVWFNQYKEFVLNNNKLLRYESLTDDEKRELVSALCSDFGVEGKNVVIRLRFPYQDIAKTLNFTQVDRVRTMFGLLVNNLTQCQEVPPSVHEQMNVLRSRTMNDDFEDKKAA